MVCLDDILRYKREHRPPAPPDLEQRVAQAPEPRSLLECTGSYRAFLIAECKQASPSQGVIASTYDPVGLAQIYQDSGAAAISVLTEEKFFQGSLAHLEQVRGAVEIPVLRKDFTLDERDVMEARAYGADLVLLIARVLADDELPRLIDLTGELGMEVIVEVHDEDEVQRALQARAEIIGINNRDLSTFEIDLSVTRRLLKLIPRDVTVISESGITRGEEVHRLQEAGVNGVLVGQALMEAADPAALVRELVDAGCPDCWRERTEAAGRSQVGEH